MVGTMTKQILTDVVKSKRGDLEEKANRLALKLETHNGLFEFLRKSGANPKSLDALYPLSQRMVDEKLLNDIRMSQSDITQLSLTLSQLWEAEISISRLRGYAKTDLTELLAKLIRNLEDKITYFEE